MGTAANVLVGVNGGVAFAPTGSTLPETATDVLDAAFNDLGFISDDGLVEKLGTSTNPIKNWKGDTVRRVQTEHALSYKFTMIESTDDTEEAYYGTDPSLGISAVQGQRGCWVADVFDGDISIRIVIPDGQVTERGDVTYKNDEAIAYDITVECYPDEDGNKAYRLKDDGGS